MPAHSTHVSLSQLVLSPPPVLFLISFPTEVLPCVRHCRICDVDDVYIVGRNTQPRELLATAKCVCVYIIHIYTHYILRTVV